MILGELYALTAADGLEYWLSDNESRFVVSTIDSAGLPPIDFLTRRPYRADRLVEEGVRLNPRSFSIAYQFLNDCGRDDYWLARSELLNVVRPNRGDALTVTILLSNGEKRAIKARALTPVFPSVPVDQVNEWNLSEILQFDAFDPTFFNPDAVTAVVSNEPSDELAFPIAFDDNGIWFGAGSGFGNIAINYTGTWYTYPRITITPPYSSIRIHHSQLNVDLEILRASSTRTVIIDLDVPSIVDDLGNSLFNYLTPDSDLQGFRLEAEPIVANGLNTLVFTIPGSSGLTGVSVEYNTRYIGI